MSVWLIIAIGLGLGAFIYVVLRRSVAQITDTPVWLLWLVLFTPAISLILWLAMYGSTIPGWLIAVFLFLSPLVYLWLVQVGRRPVEHQEELVNLPEPLISLEEEKQLRACFPWQMYYLQTIDYRPQVVICRGKLRNKTDVVYQVVSSRIKNLFADRFYVIFQEASQGRTFFALVPNSPSGEVPQQGILAIALLVITFFTTMAIGVEIAGLSTKQLQSDPALLWLGLPYSLVLMGILITYESSHYLVALAHRLPTSPPFFIPLPFFLGTLGALVQLRSPIPHRRALFDISVAGPLAGLLVALPILALGLVHSQVIPLTGAAGALNFQALDPRFSILLVAVVKLVLGSSFGVNQAIQLHPIAVAAYGGLAVIAFNLMPVGPLAGGKIVHAMYGQRAAKTITNFSRGLALVLALLHPELIFLAILLFLLPNQTQPALNDVSELNGWRDILGLIVLILLLLIILPPSPPMLRFFQV